MLSHSFAVAVGCSCSALGLETMRLALRVNSSSLSEASIWSDLAKITRRRSENKTALTGLQNDKMRQDCYQVESVEQFTGNSKQTVPEELGMPFNCRHKYVSFQTYSHMPSASGSVTAAVNTFNTPWLHQLFLERLQRLQLYIPDRLMPPSTWKTWRFCGGFRGWWTAQMLETWPRSAAGWDMLRLSM